MKISKYFNENRTIGSLFYIVFKAFYFLEKKWGVNSEFQLLGDKPPKLYIPYHPIPESNLYGHIQVLKKYIKGGNDLFEIHIQHGVVLGRLVQKIMIDSFAKIIITYSEKRKEIVQEATGKRVIAIGPYIKYADSRLSKEALNTMKMEFGKTLLVFPAHSSVDRTTINFDQISLIKKIKEVKEKHGVSTVLINLFYSDCTKEAIDFYESEGFKVCSAGFWLSENFLPNLRTIIELSDFTMSNRVGSHIGYCVALGRPHYIYKQEYSEDFIGKKGVDDLKQTFDNENEESVDTQKIEAAFSEEKFMISEHQLSIVNDYWGNNIFYTPKELFNLIS